MTSATPRHPGETPRDFLHAVAQSVGLPMACLDWPDGYCLWATPAYAQLFGVSTLELTSQHPRHFMMAEDWEQWHSAMERLARIRVHGASLQTSLVFAAHRSMPVHLVALAENASVHAIVVVPQQDASITHAMQMLHECDMRLRRYAQATQEAILFFRERHIFDANPAAIALTGYPVRQLQTLPVLHLFPHVLRADSMRLLEQGTCGTYETRLLRYNGQEIDVEINISLLSDQGENTGLLVLRDISARKRAEAEMHFLAFHDPLTRLPNRQGLQRQLSQVIQRAGQSKYPVAMLCVDLDHFKDVNDSLGHETGDKVLIEVSRRLRSKVHPDDIVARLGADEFVVVLTSPLTACQPECIAREIRFVLNKPYQLPGGQAHLPASMGISLYPEDGRSADELMLNAAAALESAKQIGRGATQYYSALLDTRPSRQLEQDRLLREALNGTGLLLHYQPQWNLQTRQLEGFEALVRWQHPQRGLLLPGEFIAFAESRGLISMLDRWVMRTACRQLRAWRDAGLPAVSVSVNMSAVEFNQRHLVTEIEQLLRDADIEPQWLEIELTETTLMKQSEHVLHTLQALQQLGVRLSIDDFGTGYSSLAYLKRYPLDKLKIDRTFIKDMPHESEDVSLVSAIIHMARSLNLRTVAEGVETLEQWQLLQRLGCDLAQGYYLSRPMPAEEATRWQRQPMPPAGA